MRGPVKTQSSRLLEVKMDMTQFKINSKKERQQFNFLNDCRDILLDLEQRVKVYHILSRLCKVGMNLSSELMELIDSELLASGNIIQNMVDDLERLGSFMVYGFNL